MPVYFVVLSSSKGKIKDVLCDPFLSTCMHNMLISWKHKVHHVNSPESQVIWVTE